MKYMKGMITILIVLSILDIFCCIFTMFTIYDLCLWIVSCFGSYVCKIAERRIGIKRKEKTNNGNV